MKWKGKKVLVTGAGGFIGSHVVERLVELGADTLAFVHYNALGSRGWLDKSHVRDDVEIVAGDVCDRDSVKEAVKGRDIVFHLAALIAIPYSYCAPTSYLRTNVEGTLNLLQAVREKGVECIVHTSTSEVYGTARYVPIDETHPLQGQSPYSASKIGADKMVEAYYSSYGVPAVTVRPFNTFGPRQSARAVIPTIITQCLSGDVLRLGNVRPTRDMNYVENTVEGLILAAGSPSAIGRTINLGSGREISIGGLAELISELIGKSIAIENIAERMRPDKSEVGQLLADNTLARSLLGWEPLVKLEDGLRRTIEWMTDNIGMYRHGVYDI